MTNTETVQQIYEAFGRGDVAYILDRLTDDIDWATESSTGAAPWHGRCVGKQEVPRFFEGIGTSTEVTDFTPLAMTSGGDDVMVVISYGARSRATGREVTMNIHHWWRFRDGKVALYRGSEDTAAVAPVFS